MSVQFEIISLLHANVPQLTLGEAFAMADQLIAIAEKKQEESAHARAVHWATNNFTSGDTGNYKTKCIKEIRERFGLSLADSKELIETLKPNAFRPYFPKGAW